MSPRGGKRPNAGPPRIDPEEQHPPRVTVVLSRALLRFAQDFGDGHPSLGIRRALELARDISETAEESE